ncbi:MAG TPA: biopolymer transporter ExbD [Longimicrobiaceae bacterium]|jgi:biopolymer transport protein ExbD|nr:biopolymer transporter ExbD [Longimicrobiaceae bacterium]
MAMAVGGRKGGPSADINITPMIDILLVLLIIFMVVQTGLQKGLSVQVPPIEETELAQNVDQIVLDVEPGAYLLNQQPVPARELEARLREVFAPRPRKVIFIKGAENVRYGEIAHAVDVARAAGIEIVGLVPRSAPAP